MFRLASPVTRRTPSSGGAILGLLTVIAVLLAGCGSPIGASPAASDPRVLNAANSATKDYNSASALPCNRSIPIYLRAITKDTSYTSAYVALGNCYATLGYFSEAIVEYNKAIMMDPMQVGLYIARGAAEYSKGNSGTAVADLKVALQVAPAQPPTYVSIATAFDSYQDYADAIAAMNKAISMTKSNPAFYETRASMYLHAQEPTFAYNDYQQAIRIAPSEAFKASIYIDFANVYLQQQDFDAARRAAARAIQLQSHDAHVYVQAGNIYQQAGDLHGAVYAYQQALGLAHHGPDVEAAHEAKGDVVARLGDTKTAIGEYRLAESLTKDPGARASLANKIKAIAAAPQ